MSRYFLPGSNPYSFACSSTAGAGVHPVLHRLLSLAPKRTELLALVGENAPVAEEEALRCAGGQMLEVFAQNLPRSYREKGQRLEDLFRMMVEHALDLAHKARFMHEQGPQQADTTRQALITAYVAAQHVIGAQCRAMDLYNSKGTCS